MARRHVRTFVHRCAIAGGCDEHFGIAFNNEVADGIANLGWDVQIEAALELFQAPPD